MFAVHILLRFIFIQTKTLLCDFIVCLNLVWIRDFDHLKNVWQIIVSSVAARIRTSKGTKEFSTGGDHFNVPILLKKRKTRKNELYANYERLEFCISFHCTCVTLSCYIALYLYTYIALYTWSSDDWKGKGCKDTTPNYLF